MKLLTIILVLVQWSISIYFTPQIYVFIVNYCFPKRMVSYISQQGIGLGFGLGILLLMFIFSICISIVIGLTTGVLHLKKQNN